MLKKTVSLTFFGLLTCFMFSQNITETNTDSIYFKALDLYKNQQFETSLDYTNRGLQLAPNYHDIRILRIRNFWALKKFTNAENDIKFLLKNAGEYPGVRQLAERQVNYNKDPEASLLFLQSLEENYGLGTKLKVLKSSLYLKTNNRKEARDLALQLFNEQGLEDDDRYTLQNILKRTIANEIGINYQYISFSDDYTRRDSWHTISPEFQHYFNRTAVIARVNYTDRSFDQGTLYELEAYPVFSDKVYTFINAGFSDGTIFPDFRGSASIFVNFLKNFELEAGGRLLHFTDQDYFTAIAGLTAYKGKFYLNVRTFLGPKRLNKLIQNYQFNLRYYFKDADNYLFGRLGSGISPDERAIFTQVQQNPGLEAYYFNLGWNKTLGNHHIIQIGGGMLFEDINANTKGNQLIGNLGYRFRF